MFYFRSTLFLSKRTYSSVGFFVLRLTIGETVVYYLVDSQYSCVWGRKRKKMDKKEKSMKRSHKRRRKRERREKFKKIKREEKINDLKILHHL